jgi:predicted DNA-binding transcriptional regulator AlpA
MQSVPAEALLLYSAEKLAGVLGVSVRHLWALHSSNRLGPQPIALGRRKVWSRDEIERWVAAGCPSREKWLELQGVSA